MQKIDRFLKLMNDRGASDLHLTVGRPPMLRVSGSMESIRYRIISEADFTEMLRAIVPERLWETFVATGDVDLSHELAGVARYRVNLFRQQRGAGAVFRIIPSKIMSVGQLGLPDAVRRVAKLESGLVLVTGPTGSGKSTTLAAIIDLINDTRSLHIITIEDPIEFVHPNKKCLIHQREIGTHATSFAEALKAAAREDPDLILVGEMRDVETISMALSADAPVGPVPPREDGNANNPPFPTASDCGRSRRRLNSRRAALRVRQVPAHRPLGRTRRATR